MSAPIWKDLLPTPPADGQLLEAWMTSFERPDAGLLVEHLLPSLLGASQSLSLNPQERSLFFGELGTTLEKLLGKFTVISSAFMEGENGSQYPWLWRYVSHFIVGAESSAVQHSKLWAFHWRSNDQELLELHVSSTNLTMSAFKDQIQAGWRITLPLEERASLKARRTWGELAAFLDALGASAGDIAAARIQRLVTLLSRVECPPDVTFVASVPGQTSAARQLKKFELSAIHLLTPTIGEWNDRNLAAWSADAGTVPGKIHLKWISQRHIWAGKSSGWALSTSARMALESNGVRLDCLPDEMALTNQHFKADARWCHAKLYLLRSRRKRWLLVTSANWSIAAWGAGKVAPLNFELGVLFECDWRHLEALDEPFDPPETIPFCVDRASEEDSNSKLQWAEASWDGRRILLRARSSDSAMPITVHVTFMGGLEKSVSLAGSPTVMMWKDPTQTPLFARFTQNAQMLQANVVDLRPIPEFIKTPLPEVDPAVSEALREAFLLERYGGAVVDHEGVTGLVGARTALLVSAQPADYSVQAWVDARSAFSVVDQWLDALNKAKSDPNLLERVRLDGEALKSLYARRNGPAAALVVQELGWRLCENA